MNLSFFCLLIFATLSRESEGSFQFSNYHTEVEDIRAVTEYFTRANRKIVAILGHSKGAPTCQDRLFIVFQSPVNDQRNSILHCAFGET